MKGWIGGLIVLGLMGMAFYYYFINQPDAVLISGDKMKIEQFKQEQESVITSSDVYKEKLAGNIENKIHTDVRVLSKTTAEKLIKDKMLQKKIKGTDTEPISSLPNISKEKGIVYTDNKVEVPELIIQDFPVTITKEEGEVGIGVGRNQETQEKLIILDDSIYEKLPLAENAFYIVHYNFLSTFVGYVRGKKNSEKEEIQMMTMKTRL